MAATLVLLARTPIAAAITEAEQSFLTMYFTPEELLVVSATRSLQSITRIAENIEVVTADDIELMNAHTLAEVLNNVTGVKVNFTGAFGAAALPFIQGSSFDQVTVLIDAVPLNDVGNQAVDVGFVPVTDIARIEIIKGPASSAWGSALGGVVNIITKDPAPRSFQGLASIDYGTENSLDYRAAVSGRIGRFGYYLSGTGLRTDGLTDGFDVDTGFAGAKLSYDFSARASVSFNFSYADGHRGDGNAPEYDLAWDRDNRETVARLALRTAVGAAGRLEVSLWSIEAEEDYVMRLLGTGEEQSRTTNNWDRTGAGLTYAVSAGRHSLVAGTDFASGTIESSDFPGSEQEVDQWAVYANDTIALGGLALVPGIRYDNLSICEDFVSPSLGATYALSRNALLRATVARGFSAPKPTDSAGGTSELLGYKGNPELKPETVWSYQAGVETNLLDAIWLKAALFRHDLDDAFVEVDLGEGYRTTVNSGSQRRQGLELGLKTVPYHHLTLSAGATFMEGEDRETDKDLDQIPKSQYNLSLKYDDERSFRALLTGNYRDEVYEPEEIYNADFSGFIVDLHLAKKFPLGPRSAVEAFVSVHNLFNGDQYWASIYPNPDRWVEGGLRVAF